MEDPSRSQGQIVGRAQRYGTVYLEPCARTRDDPTGIQEEEVGACDFRANESVDEGRISASDARQDGFDVRGTAHRQTAAARKS